MTTVAAPNFTIRPAKREQIHFILGLAGPSGSGKSRSGLRLAKGMSGGKRIGAVDTENGRLSMDADRFEFDVIDLAPPFSPLRYGQAILELDKRGYPVILVDSTSHEWAGIGGILDWQEEELNRMAGEDYKKREACKMAAWVKPKMAHKEFLFDVLLRVRAHLILCFRAEPKIEMRKDSSGKFEIVPKEGATSFEGWTPICEKNLPFELTASFMLLPDKPGVPHPIKALRDDLVGIFPKDKQLDETAGEQLAAWAAGGAPRTVPPAPVPARPAAPSTSAPARPPGPAPAVAAPRTISAPQANRLIAIARANGWEEWQIKAQLEERGCQRSLDIKVQDYAGICEYFQKNKPAAAAAAPDDQVVDADADGRCPKCGATPPCDHIPF